MAGNTSKVELRNTWESAAPGWAKWERVFSAGLSSVTDALIDMAGIRSGMRVLDLACGAGSQSIQAAKCVGPNGTVVAIDTDSGRLAQSPSRLTAPPLEPSLDENATGSDRRSPSLNVNWQQLGQVLGCPFVWFRSSQAHVEPTLV
jgi:hypothetical protein